MSPAIFSAWRCSRGRRQLANYQDRTTAGAHKVRSGLAFQLLALAGECGECRSSPGRGDGAWHFPREVSQRIREFLADREAAKAIDLVYIGLHCLVVPDDCERRPQRNAPPFP
jgi:hypothetical protein